MHSILFPNHSHFIPIHHVLHLLLVHQGNVKLFNFLYILNTNVPRGVHAAQIGNPCSKRNPNLLPPNSLRLILLIPNSPHTHGVPLHYHFIPDIQNLHKYSLYLFLTSISFFTSLITSHILALFCVILMY